jgi:hypothetical protein
MKYDMTRPCDLCPFRRDTKGLHGLHPSTAAKFGEQMLGTQGGSFVCHKTTRVVDDDFVDAGEDSKACAGSLIFAEKNGNATQLMRIMERLGFYDPEKLMSQPKEVLDSVFDDLDEMIEANRRASRRPKRKRK